MFALFIIFVFFSFSYCVLFIPYILFHRILLALIHLLIKFTYHGWREMTTKNSTSVCAEFGCIQLVVLWMLTLVIAE